MLVKYCLTLLICEFTTYAIKNSNKSQKINDSFPLNIQEFEETRRLESLIFSKMGSLPYFFENSDLKLCDSI